MYIAAKVSYIGSVRGRALTVQQVVRVLKASNVIVACQEWPLRVQHEAIVQQ